MIGKYYVFEFECDNKHMKQISIALDSLDDANSFIETMKDGMYYKSMRPDIILVAAQVLSTTEKKTQDKS